MLGLMGCRADAAANGLEAVEAVQRTAYDVVLMDLQMPEMDGLAATAEIRRREAANGRHTPILAYTAHAMEEDRRHCLEAGMDGYLVKPVCQRDLYEVLAEWSSGDPGRTLHDGRRPAAIRGNDDHRRDGVPIRRSLRDQRGGYRVRPRAAGVVPDRRPRGHRRHRRRPGGGRCGPGGDRGARPEGHQPDDRGGGAGRLLPRAGGGGPARRLARRARRVRRGPSALDRPQARLGAPSARPREVPSLGPPASAPVDVVWGW